MLRKIIFYILILCTCTGYAQNNGKAPKVTPVKTLLKDARAAIKNKRDQKNREKALLDALKRKETNRNDSVEIYYMSAALERSLNDAENLKAYLKQKYDTANYYNTMLLSTQYTLLCDSLDMVPDSNGVSHPRYRSKNRESLLMYRANLYLGGRFFLRKSDYKKSYDFLSIYTDLSKNDLLAGSPKLQNDTLLQYSTYYSVLSAYNTKNYFNVLRYVDDAISYADSSRAPILQEYKVRCLQSLNRNDEWLQCLLLGVKDYPKHDYFFINLAKYYEDKKLYDEGLILADSMLINVQDATLYWYTKSLMYLQKEQWMDCIHMADTVLAREPEHINALYNVAVSYVNEAADFTQTACNDIRNPKSRQDRQHLQSLYRAAQKPSEELRRLRPDAVTSWAPLLYRIYLNLNMGEEFSEIEKIMKSKET